MMLLTWTNLAYYQDLMAGPAQGNPRGAAGGFHRADEEGWEQGERERKAG